MMVIVPTAFGLAGAVVVAGIYIWLNLRLHTTARRALLVAIVIAVGLFAMAVAPLIIVLQLDHQTP